MISLRQHTVSLVAVFLALAVGIALGGGPLADGDEPDDTPTSAGLTPGPRPVADDTDAYAEAVVGAGAARLYANGLAGHASAILVMPGADPAQVKALQTQITTAGGAITGTYAVGAAMVDPADQELVDSVGSQLATQLVDPRIDPAAPPYDRMGTLLALAMATNQVISVRADPAAVTIRDTLASAELLTSPPDVRNAPLVLVVLPPGEDAATTSTATRALLAGLVNGLGTNTAGVVVAGDRHSAEQGELGALRESDLVGPISTVDGVETSIGQVMTVLAMIAAVSGTTGSYGAWGSDGVVPLG